MKKHERRQFGRRGRNVCAEIVTAHRPPLSCIVRNISTGGALLEIDANYALPLHFRLCIPTDGFEADCELRRQTPHGVGVYFIDVQVLRRGRDSRFCHDLPTSFAENERSINSMLQYPKQEKRTQKSLAELRSLALMTD